MVTRVIHATVKMACCRDGQEVYKPYPREVIAMQSRKRFDEPIELWKRRAEHVLYAKYNQIAENECSTMGTLILCYFNLTVNKAIETKIPIVESKAKRITERKKIPPSRITSTPNFIYQQMELIRERMTEADSVDEFIALKDEMNKLRERYNIR